MKLEALKGSKYINSRVDEVYPARKSSERCSRLPYAKERAKEPSSVRESLNASVNRSVASSFSVKTKTSFTCGNDGTSNATEHSDPSSKDMASKGFRRIEKCNQSVLQDVIGLHVGSEKSDSAKVDMEKALKGLVARDFAAISSSLAESSRKLGDLPSISSRKLSSEFHIQGRMIPLDFTLKTSLRLVSSSTVKWCHSLSMSPFNAGIDQFASNLFGERDQHIRRTSGSNTEAEILYSKALHSWSYPHHPLPPSMISAMATSTVPGEADFLSQRQHDWEDSFRSLYYMLRKNMCDIFYVYTSQFVALFVGCKLEGKKKRSCNAYISQSTRGLRSLLRSHDVGFSMPLCCTELEQPSEDDLVELSEIEKRSLGQTFQLDSLAHVDSSPQSLLAFIGNENVHSLYDFLLNHRFFLHSLAGADVPVLYSPLPFQNASLSIPQVRCKEMKRADQSVPSSNGIDFEDTEAILGASPNNVCYSIDIKDTILPPWIVCGICAALSSDGRSFDSSFTADPSSIGLNVALDSLCTEESGSILESNDFLPGSANAFGISEAALTTCLRSATLRRLKYSNGSHVVYVTPV